MTTAPLILLGLMMTAFVSWLVMQTLHTRPWEEQRPIFKIHGEGQFQVPAQKVGLGVFLAVVAAVFSLFVSAYFMRMQHGTDWVAVSVPRVLWANTAVLILASAGMEWTRQAARADNRPALSAALLAGGAATWAFLAGQLWAWQQIQASGQFALANPATAFFYLLTAVHGLHLLGGLWVWGRSTARVLRGAGAGEVRMSVELCATYWHFLLLVWLVLFGVLSAAPGPLGHPHH